MTAYDTDDFSPTGVALIAVVGGKRVRPCELYGNFVVIQAFYEDTSTHVLAGVFTVAHLETERVLGEFGALKIARNFARWLNNLPDFTAVFERWQRDAWTEEDEALMEYVDRRRRHVAFMEFSHPVEGTQS